MSRLTDGPRQRGRRPVQNHLQLVIAGHKTCIAIIMAVLSVLRLSVSVCLSVCLSVCVPIKRVVYFTYRKLLPNTWKRMSCLIGLEMCRCQKRWLPELHKSPPLPENSAGTAARMSRGLNNRFGTAAVSRVS